MHPLQLPLGKESFAGRFWRPRASRRPKERGRSWLLASSAGREFDLAPARRLRPASGGDPELRRGPCWLHRAEEVAREALRWFKSQPEIDPRLLLALEVRGVSERRTGDAARRFWRDVLARAVAARASLIEVLDALADETARRPGHRSEAILAVCDVLAAADDRSARAILRWALGSERAREGWIAPYLRAAAASLGRLRTAGRGFAMGRAYVRRRRIVCEWRRFWWSRREPGVVDEIFRWGVETQLLPIAESERPRDPSWPGAYLDRMPSGLDLMRRLFTREYRELGVKPWLDAARERGELSAGQVEQDRGVCPICEGLEGGRCEGLVAG